MHIQPCFASQLQSWCFQIQGWNLHHALSLFLVFVHVKFLSGHGFSYGSINMWIQTGFILSVKTMHVRVYPVLIKSCCHCLISSFLSYLLLLNITGGISATAGKLLDSLLILEDLYSSLGCCRISLRGKFIWKSLIDINLTSDRYFLIFGISSVSFGGMETWISGTCGMSSRVMNVMNVWCVTSAVWSGSDSW